MSNHGGRHANPVSREFRDGLLENPVSTLTRQAVIDSASDTEVVIENLEYLGSYNWTDTEHPTIIVPGSPREWRDRRLPFQVPLDTGRNFIDQNAYRMGRLVLLPLIQAVETVIADGHRPAFNWSSVDFVTDRNSLRKLLRWATRNGTAACNDFRIDTQLAGKKTILLTRWEKMIEIGNDGQISYGHNLEHAATTPANGCEAGTGHHRIVTYDFGGLKMVVRFEVDACLPSPAPVMRDHEESLADLMSDLRIGDATPLSTSTPDIEIIRGGRIVPQSSIIEVQTKSQSARKIIWRDHFPQLYLSQTPHHYLAIHENGNFSVVRKARIGEGELARAENNVRPGLNKLRSVLEAVHHLVREQGPEGRITLICTEGVLKLYERSSRESLLPGNILALFI